MKVPTYKRQLQRTDRTGAGMLTAQVNPNVMALAGQGLANAGQQLFSFGADMLEVETKKQQLAIKNESSQAVQNLNTELKGLRLETNKILNPHEAETYWAENSQKVYTNVFNSLSKNARTLFTIDGQKIFTDMNYNFRLDNDPKIPEHTKKLAAGETAIIAENVSNPNNSLAVRTNALISLIGGNRKNTDNFAFAQAPKSNVGYSRDGGFTEKENNLLNTHRLNISNNTYLENADKSITTIYITGIRNPAEGKNSPIYAVPGYYNGKKYSKEEEQELQKIATEEGWFNVYPFDPDAKSHKKRVNKLHKLIDKDGKALSKIEKTFSKGLNFSLYENDIVDFNEFTVLNNEVLSTVTTDILKNLMHGAEDADDVIESVMDNKINDPIFNMIWQDLPIEEKDKILRTSKDIAEDIEGFKNKQEKEKDEQYDEELKTVKRKLFNETDLNEAIETHKFILSIDGYDNFAQKESAEKLIEKLKGTETSGVTFRTTAEGNDGQTYFDLAEDDKNNELTYESVMEAGRKGLLLENTWLSYMDKVGAERNEGLSFGLDQFKRIYGYTENMDKDDNLGKIVEAAFNKSSANLSKWVQENNDATYDEIVEQHEIILEKNNKIFKDTIRSARNQSLAFYNNGYVPFDILNLTNQEIIEKATAALVAPNADTIAIKQVINKFGYYQLQEVDK